MTLRQKLQEQFQSDLAKAPESITNKNGIELHLDKNQQIYVGYDKIPRKWALKLTKKIPLLFDFLLQSRFWVDREWIAAIQFPATNIPIFYEYCKKCKAPNIVGIWQQNTKISCRMCGKQNLVDIKSSLKSIQEILERLDIG